MIEVADILREHFPDFLASYSIPYEQYKAVNALINCRTAALGAHIDTCDSCGHESQSYNSCRNRHCPKCQQSQTDKWLSKRQESLLDVPYFHTVFTVPNTLYPFMLSNQAFAYNLLFKAASETLLEVAASDKFLGAKIGFTAVLHTWGQNLAYHPHLHCIVMGGGLDSTGTQFVKSRKDYFLPVKVLSKVFRGKFIFHLQKALENPLIAFLLPSSSVPQVDYFPKLIKSLYKHDWVVYTKPTFDHPQAVLKYLSHYTHRIAISNTRIISLKAGMVTFYYKDYKDNSKRKTMTLTAVEFIRRFLMHILPTSFVKILHYGLLYNRSSKENLKRYRKLLGISCSLYSLLTQDKGPGLYKYPTCKKGYMHFSQTLKRGPTPC